MGFASFEIARKREQAAKEKEVEAVEPETKPKRTRRKKVNADGLFIDEGSYV